MRAPSADVVDKLIGDGRLTPDQVTKRLARGLDPDYWRKLSPGLQVLHPGPLGLSARSAWESDAGAVETLRADGVFHAKQVIGSHAVGNMNAALDAVVREGWPAVFAFVYDEFWRCNGVPSVERIVAGALGEGCMQIPHIWTHVVQPIAGAAGFPPHIDGNRGNRMSVWIALTEATVENGCMYVVPRSAAPDQFSERFYRQSDFTWADLTKVLHAVRAVPATAGDALGWMFDVVHWGGRAQPPTTVRRAISLEFIAASEAPGADELPLIPIGHLPSWSERLRAIASALIAYRKFQPLVGRFEGVASGILERTNLGE